MISPPVACPACGTVACSSTMDYHEFPAFLFPVAKDMATAIEAADLALHLCAECGHIFQDKVDRALHSRIYEEYYADYPYDDNGAMVQAYRQPFHHFFDLMLPTHAFGAEPRLIEIGCSRPANMTPFADKGWRCTGIDPSPLAENADACQNITILSGYYEDTAAGEVVDAIVSRFNLEHIADLTAHLLKMKQDLKDGGRVIVQVPNVAYYLENCQPLFVAHEHIHYFSQNSLVRLFERMGFTALACFSAGQPSVLACFEKRAGSFDPAEPVARLVDGYKANVAAKAEELARRLHGKKQVVFYGCGLALYWALYVLRGRLPPQVTIVDDNPALEGKALPLHGFPVHRPTPELLADGDLIVLTLNPIYHDAVVARLRSQKRPMELLRISVDRLETEKLQ